MHVAVIGTGNMGRAIATRILTGGHIVTFIGTHIAKADDLAEELAGLGDVHAADQVTGQVAVLAVPYTEAPHVVRHHAGALARDMVIIDPTNPVDIGTMERVEDVDGSGAETIAAAAPDGARVVKAFNTAFAGTVLAGDVAGQPLDIFLAGDDAAAKSTVAELVTGGGMRPLDTGGLVRARELEALGYLHMVIQPGLGFGFASAVKILTP
jgi:8-hydroxy-5-deazaflavin:NADPH oxidoreductase